MHPENNRCSLPGTGVHPESFFRTSSGAAFPGKPARQPTVHSIPDSGLPDHGTLTFETSMTFRTLPGIQRSVPRASTTRERIFGYEHPWHAYGIISSDIGGRYIPRGVITHHRPVARCSCGVVKR